VELRQLSPEGPEVIVSNFSRAEKLLPRIYGSTPHRGAHSSRRLATISYMPTIPSTIRRRSPSLRFLIRGKLSIFQTGQRANVYKPRRMVVLET
jgi:hypothetical protein